MVLPPAIHIIWIQFWNKNSEIHNGESDIIWRTKVEKVGTWGIFEIADYTNVNSKFRDSKWRIQHGGSKYKNLLVFDETRNSRIFEIADYECELEIQKLKIAKKLLVSDKTRYSEIFEIADYESVQKN